MLSTLLGWLLKAVLIAALIPAFFMVRAYFWRARGLG